MPSESGAAFAKRCTADRWYRSAHNVFSASSRWQQGDYAICSRRGWRRFPMLFLRDSRASVY